MDVPALNISPLRSADASRQKTLAAGLFLVLGFLSAPSHAVEPWTDHDVVIAGPGAAGLYAAYNLDNLGYDVLIVEARHEQRGASIPTCSAT
jgi:hypothetical protein